MELVHVKEVLWEKRYSQIMTPFVLHVGGIGEKIRDITEEINLSRIYHFDIAEECHAYFKVQITKSKERRRLRYIKPVGQCYVGQTE